MGSNLGTATPSFLNDVDSHFTTLDDLFTAGEAVEQLLAHPGWAHVTALLDVEIAEIEATTDGRLLESKSHYAFAHGRMGGLRGARQAAEAILSRARLRLEQQQAKHEGDAESSPERG